MNPTVQESRTLKITTPSDRELAMTRTFDAPRNPVFDAWTKPELLKRWLIRRGWQWATCEVDLRVGGKYRFVWRGPNGKEMGMGGVYREIVPNERMVSTEQFDDPWYEGEAEATITFVERSGRTTVTQTVRYDSREIRDGVLKSPMESGINENYSNLDEVLQSMQAQKMT